MKGGQSWKISCEEQRQQWSGGGGIQGVEGQIRALLLALEARTAVKINPRMPIVTFLPEYAAYLVNRLEVGKDGKTAYERVRGKKATVLGIEFGEKLLYKVKIKNKLEKINARWELGIFVGVRRRSGEVWVAFKGQVISVRSVRRIPEEERWSKDCVEWVDRVMWNRYKDDEGADGDVPEGVPAGEPASSGSTRCPGIIIIETKNKPPREFYIKKSDAERLGYTRGCGGCNSWHRGLGRQPHTEACRARFKELMKDEARVQNAEERKKEFEEREVNKKRRKEEKKEEKKRKADDHSIEEDRIENRDEDMHVAVVKEEIANWVCEIGVAVLEQDAERKEEVEIEDHADELSPGEIEEARGEEIEFLLNRKIWCEKPVQECWSKTGKAPVSVRWVDVRKGSGEVRSRLVARDFKAGEKGRDDLFAATPPLEGKRLLVSRAVTRRKDGKKRKLRFIDAKKAHLNPPCHEDVYFELPDEAGRPNGVWQAEFLAVWFSQGGIGVGGLVRGGVAAGGLYPGSRVWSSFLSSSARFTMCSTW